MRRIVQSASAERRLAAAESALRAAAGELIVLAPTRAAADDFVRRAAGAGVAGAHRMTLPQLAAALAADSGLAPITALGAEAVCARAVHEVRGALEYFGPVADLPGFPGAAGATLGELRLALLEPADLADHAPPCRDLARLLAAYERELAERKLADYALMLRLAVERTAAPHRYLGLPVLLLDVRARTAAEQALLRAVIACAPSVFATALPGDRTLEALLDTLCEPLDPEPASSLERLRKHIFSPEPPPVRERDQSVELFSAAGEGLEAIEIARRIRALGTPFDRVAVLLREPERYQPLIEDALRRAGIPAYFTRGVVRPDPAGRAFLALLACAAEGLSATRFAEYLSFAQVPSNSQAAEWVPPESYSQAEAPAPPSRSIAAPAYWEKLLVEASVAGGRDRWERRLSGLAEEWRMRQEPPERRLALLDSLRQFALPLIARLDALPRLAHWRGWLEALRGLAAASLGRPESVLAVLAELEPMAEVGPASLEEVRAVLAGRLGLLRREPPPRRYGAVFVASIAEAAGASFETVFVPGLAEGMFPRRPAEDPLLLDEYRGRLGAGLPLQADRNREERMLLAAALGAASARVVLSYPRIDVGQGRARVPSFYALEVLRAAEGRVPEVREIERRAAAASTTRLGWPAARDAAGALDEIEYDLAALEPWLAEPPERVRGRGYYLVKASPTLAGSLRARWMRSQARWSPADGIWQPPAAALAVLATHRLLARQWSASALQHFAACPYRFYLKGILRIEPREEAARLEQLDARTRGALFHAVQHAAFLELRARGLLPVAHSNLAEAVDAADEVLNRVAEEYRERLAPAIDRVWNAEMDGLRSDLRNWIHELVPIHAQWLPVEFEREFTDVSVLDAVRLRGIIDVVERHASRALLRVTDHKTGAAPAPAPRWTGGGETLQPLLYACAVERIFGEPADSGVLFYATRRGHYVQIRIQLDPQSRAALRAVLNGIDAAIEHGLLPAAPRHGACDYCDYRPVCGPGEEARARRKPEFEPLVSLRRIR